MIEFFTNFIYEQDTFTATFFVALPFLTALIIVRSCQ
jgi:hypothetical protein